MKKLPIFKLEEYFSKYEFNQPYMLGSSDPESWKMSEIIAMADNEYKEIWDNLFLGYTETFGHPLLRKEIAQLHGKSIKDQNIACFAGAGEGIYIACHSLLESTDHAIIITPCYQSLKEIPKSICAVTAVSIEYEKNWILDLNKIKNAIQPNTKALIINYPHNPTGASLTHDQQQELVEMARTHNLWIISDEVYRHAEVNPQDKLADFASLYEKALSIGVVSKAYGLPGLRVGWIACKDLNILKQLEQQKHYLSICNSAPSEILALIALRNIDKIIKRNKQIVQSNLKLLDAFFIKNKNILEWVRPTGGCTGFVKIKLNMSADEFCKQLRDSKGVLILPSSLYDCKDAYFRIGFGRKNMPEALEKLQEFLNEINQ
jgi:aspartate/methionine/tyrosine aminotransferase